MGRRIPDRWDAYSAFGSIIRGTRFLPFKVPLKESLCQDLPTDQWFTPGILMERLRMRQQQQQQPMQLGLVIDLTNTKRYYSPQEITKHNVRYEKIFTEGHNVPADAVQHRFKEIVDRFLWENNGNGLLIGVHCTHGVNRTGYLVCRYMIDRMKAPPADAIRAFNEGRGHVIERENYLEHLSSVSVTAAASDGELESEAVSTAAAASALLPQPANGSDQRRPGSDEQWLPAQGRGEMSEQQPSRRWQRKQERKQARREASKNGRQPAEHEPGAPLLTDYDDLRCEGRLSLPFNSLTVSQRLSADGRSAAAPGSAWPPPPGLAGRNGSAPHDGDGRRSSHARHHRLQGREERACEAWQAEAAAWPTRASAAAAGDGRGWAGCADSGASVWDRLTDAAPHSEWTGRSPADAHRDPPRYRTLSDPGRFHPASLPHPAADYGVWQPWQQLPPRAGSWHDDRGSRQQRPAVRPTVPGYCPVTLPQLSSGARAARPEPRHRGSASQR